MTTVARVEGLTIRAGSAPVLEDAALTVAPSSVVAVRRRPDVLLCDEVTAALDERTSLGVLRILRARQRDTGLAIAWATHDRALSQEFADATLLVGEDPSPYQAPARVLC
jgi:ABC-type glutathione transport system ATPase component